MSTSANDFVGLSKKRAQDLAEAKNMIFRLIRVDDKNFLSYPDDKRDDRICCEIEKEKVVVATIQ